MHPRYQEWLVHVFDHPVSRKKWWLTADAPPFDEDEVLIATLVTETFTRSGVDLARFTDAQVNQGLYYLASPGASSDVNTLLSPEVPLDLRLRGIRAIVTLYRECFAKRCSPTLSHLDEKGTALNPICYMFWDLNGLGYLQECPDPEATGDAVFGVLAAILAIPHPACQEAALHGLGHLALFFGERVQTIIDSFLELAPTDQRLHEYARAAQEGGVN